MDLKGNSKIWKRLPILQKDTSNQTPSSSEPLLAPTGELRAKIRDEIQSDKYRFVEVHVRATIATCEKRDVKGLYERQSKRESILLAGVNVPYDEPLDPSHNL